MTHAAPRDGNARCHLTDLTYAEWCAQPTKPRYRCPCGDPKCETERVLRWGNTNVAHRCRLEPKLGGTGYTCGMTEEHLRAQEGVSETLNTGGCLEISYTCTRCDTTTSEDVRLEVNERAVVEQKVEHLGGNRWADVAVVSTSAGARPRIIIEVMHTSKTLETNRPSDIPWFELRATEIISVLEEHEYVDELSLKCVRIRACPCCECLDEIATTCNHLGRLCALCDTVREQAGLPVCKQCVHTVREGTRTRILEEASAVCSRRWQQHVEEQRVIEEQRQKRQNAETERHYDERRAMVQRAFEAQRPQADRQKADLRTMHKRARQIDEEERANQQLKHRQLTESGLVLVDELTRLRDKFPGFIIFYGKRQSLQGMQPWDLVLREYHLLLKRVDARVSGTSLAIRPAEETALCELREHPMFAVWDSALYSARRKR